MDRHHLLDFRLWDDTEKDSDALKVNENLLLMSHRQFWKLNFEIAPHSTSDSRTKDYPGLVSVVQMNTSSQLVDSTTAPH